jgi:hypothetical protein
MMKWIVIFFTLATTFGCSANEGWEIKTRYYNLYENPANARIETIYLMNGYMRMDNGDLITIFDLKKGEILYYNTSNKTYWQGKPERFNAEVKEELKVMIEKELLAVDEDKRDLTRKMYEEMLRSSFPEADDLEQAPRKFAVRKVGEGEMVSGYKTQTYNVLEDGQLLESLWVAPDLSIAIDFDFIGLSQFINQLARGAYAASFESSNEYFDLLKKGYPVRVEMVKADGYTYVSDVVQAKKMKFTELHFKAPKGYTASSLTQVGVWQGYL